MSETNIPLSAEHSEERLGVVHENLEGWIPALATVSEIHEALEKAFEPAAHFGRIFLAVID